MTFRRFLPHTLSQRERRIARAGFWAVLLLVAGGLIFNFFRHKEENEPSVVRQENMKVTLLPKQSEKEGKGVKREPLPAVRKPLSGHQREKKVTPEDSRTVDNKIKGAPQDLVPPERDLPPELTKEERLAAAEELAHMDRGAIIENVMKMLDSPSADVREEALEALWNVDDEAVNAPLMKALDDENADVRESAMDAMEEIESPNILPSLEQALTHSDPDIREEALSILEDIPDHRAVDILVEKGLQHEDEIIREETLDSLEFITGQDFDRWEEALEWWYSNRDEFVFD